MPANAAITFESYAFDLTGKKLMGAQSASHGFLQAYVRHAAVERFYCFAKEQQGFDGFRKLVAQWSPESTGRLEWLPHSRFERLAEPGCLYHPNPALAESAWRRRQFDERAYSLCGVTHTTCSAGAMDTFGLYLIAPLQEWDAVICTSTSVKKTLDHVLERWSDYLAGRLGGKPTLRLQLPIIPLGVDCDHYDRYAGDAAIRQALRSELGISDDCVVFLFLGRLAFHAKAHPLPMYLALEEAARRTGKPLCLIQAGWFPNDAVQREYVNGARRFCPSVKMVFLDGRKPQIRERVWFAADVFTALADNIQETFGMVPIEAMAAGLPQVISDWDGYRDTVRDGVDGFRITTVMPPAGTAADIAARHGTEVDTYDRYIAHASQCTAVDWAECADAYVRLIENPSLRRTMGEAGRQRARERFDWSLIVAAYQELWQELAERRAKAAETSPRPSGPPHPLREDPFAVFAEYPTKVLDEQVVLELAPGSDEARLLELYASPLVNYVGAPFLMSGQDECREMFSRLSSGATPIAALLENADPPRRPIRHRTLGWMLKSGLLRIVSEA